MQASDDVNAFEYFKAENEGFSLFEHPEVPEGHEVPKNVEGKRSDYKTEETYGNIRDGKRADPCASSPGDQSHQQEEMLQLMAKMMEGMSNLQKQILDETKAP